MPKRFQTRAAQHESFEPYRTAILVIVMATFTLYGAQSITLTAQAQGMEKVTNCFTQSNQPAYHRFIECTDRTS